MVKTKATINPLIAKRIKKLRTEHNLTQVQLAEILDLTPQMVRNWEHSRNCPTFKQLMILSEKFGYDIHFLAGESDFSELEVSRNTLLTYRNLMQMCKNLGFDFNKISNTNTKEAQDEIYNAFSEIENFIESKYKMLTKKYNKNHFQIVGTYTITGSAILEYNDSVYVLEGWNEKTEQFENVIEMDDDGEPTENLFIIKPVFSDNKNKHNVIGYVITRKADDN